MIRYLALFLLALTAHADSSVLDLNKKVVVDFYDLAINRHHPAEAVQRFIGDRYIQHNPTVADGKQAFIDAFTKFQATHPTAHSEFKRVFADGDFVILHVLSKKNEADRGRAIVDIFRLENGKIVEHWDVILPIPEHSANDNTMF